MCIRDRLKGVVGQPLQGQQQAAPLLLAQCYALSERQSGEAALHVGVAGVERPIKDAGGANVARSAVSPSTPLLVVSRCV